MEYQAINAKAEEDAMLQNFFQKNRWAAEKLNGIYVFLLFSFLAFIIRFPFFFRDYIDRDESTFILMGESWLHGHLPYTELWDLKPPLVFLFFAGIIFIFGKSFLAIRMAGVLVVATTAFFTYAMGANVYSRRTGIWAGIVCVYLISLFGSLQGVMSEHLSMLSFMPGLYLLLKNKHPWYVLVAGLLMGIALMTKLNLAYAVALLGLFLIFDPQGHRSLLTRLKETALFGTGVLLIILATWMPYASQNIGQLWWNSVILAPLAYAREQQDSVFKMAPLILLIGFFFFISIRKKWLSLKNRSVQLLSLAVLGVVVSFIRGGRINGHYLIQFHPLFLVILGGVLERAFAFMRFHSRRWIWVILLLLPVESYKEYYDVIRYKIERGSFYNGEGFTVPAYLIDNHMETKDVFFLEYHIGYWFLPAVPPTRAATHPSNLCRDELFPYYNNPRKTSMEELTFIMDTLQPTIVVTRFERRIFDRKKEVENQYMVNYLAQHYRVVALVDRAEIHQRLK